MKKTDESIYNIVLASIKRHSMHIKTWKKTKLWEDGESKTRELLLSRIKIETEEIPILYILILLLLQTVKILFTKFLMKLENHQWQQFMEFKH